MTDGWKDLGAWLKAQRLRLGLRQTTLAEQAGVSRTTVAILEAGGRTVRGRWEHPSPDVETVSRLAVALDVDRDELDARVARAREGSGVTPRPDRQAEQLAVLTEKVDRLHVLVRRLAVAAGMDDAPELLDDPPPAAAPPPATRSPRPRR